jgi:ElaB/YqjD/DUF883 family membrane-anchored ribosome-binding protein
VRCLFDGHEGGKVKTVLTVLSSFALIAFTYLCITLAFAVRVNSKHTAKLLMTTADTMAKLNQTIDKLNGKGGTLQIMNEDLVRVKDTITLSQLTLFKEQKSLDLWNQNISATLSNVNNAVVAATANENEITKSTVETLNATTASVNALKPLVASMNDEAKELNTATASLNALVNDPAIMETIQHTDQTMANVQDTTKDVSHEVHEYVYPGPWKRVWGFVSGAGLDIGKFFIP